MLHSHFIRLSALGLLLTALVLPAHGVQCEYCFSSGDFGESVTGICIQEVPEGAVLLLGDRVLKPGDILTVRQAEQMVCKAVAGGNGALEVSYLPIYKDHVDPVAVFSLRKKDNQPPVAEDSAAETYKNLQNTASLKVSDPEGEALTFTVTREPRRGTVEITEDGSFTYTPKKNKVGVDSFTYTAADAAGNVSREATVTVTILKPTDAALYQDTAGEACSFAAEWMKNTGIFTGEQVDQSLCFCPQRPVSQGEFLTMLLKTLEIAPEDQLEAAGYENLPQWIRPYLAAAVRSGLTAGLPNPQLYDPDSPISEGEAAVMIQNGLDLPVPALADSQEPRWAEPAISALAEMDLELSADRPLTRAQAAQLLYRVHLSMTD